MSSRTMNVSRVSRVALAVSLALALAGLAGCDNNPAKDKSQATVAAPVTVASTNAPSTGSASYVFSAADSKLAFTGAKVTRKHEGSFASFSGTIQLVDGNPEKSTVNVEIDMPSLTVDEAKLTSHLKTPDFFDVAKYPKARFVSTSVKAGGDKGATHTVTGNLELHGITKSISFPATIKPHGDGIDIDAEFALNRKDFGVVYPGMPDDLIKDEFLVKLQVRAKKAAS
jgi:polyisoprenoid-binding protein YceI